MRKTSSSGGLKNCSFQKSVATSYREKQIEDFLSLARKGVCNGLPLGVASSKCGRLCQQVVTRRVKVPANANGRRKEKLHGAIGSRCRQHGGNPG
jgi:hypothetical protein